jgi:hypothetical protein
MACGCVYEVTPPLTNMRDLAPPKSDVPMFILIQSIAVDYLEEDIIAEAMDSCV